MEFTNKRILVTGATKGIGKSIAVSLHAKGADILAIGRSGFEELFAECSDERLTPVRLDVTDWEVAQDKLLSLGPLDGVVNNAGVAILEEVGKVTEKALRTQFETNVFAVINISQTAAKLMQPGSSIVNISSIASQCTPRNHIGYSASKAALDSVTKSLAAELGPKRIRVNAVNPGVVLTDMGRANWSDPSLSGPMLSRVPLQRFVEVDEVVSAVEFLLSDKSRMINGSTLPVDGGLLTNAL